MIAPANPPKMPDLDYSRIDAAIVQGIHDAVMNRARLGFSVSVWRDGKVVILSPEEVFAEEAAIVTNRTARSDQAS